MNLRFTPSFPTFITVIMLCVLALTSPTATPTYAQTPDAQNVEVVGHIGGDTDTRDVFVQGNYAYIGEGPSLTILDISNPASPTVVGKTALLSLYDVYVSGNTAYVAAGSSGLRVVDVSNPALPAEVGFYDTPGFASGVYVSGNTAYVVDSYSGLRVVDVSNPATPAEVGFYDTPGGASSVYVSGNTAYVTGGSGLRVVDVSNPVLPAEVGFYDTLGEAYGVYASGNTAYVADRSGGLIILRYTGGETEGTTPLIFIPGITANWWRPRVTRNFGHWPQP